MNQGVESLNPAEGFVKTEGTKMEANIDLLKKDWTDEAVKEIGDNISALDKTIQSEIAESQVFFGSAKENAESALAILDRELEQTIQSARDSETVTARISAAIGALRGNDKVFKNKSNTRAFLTSIGLESNIG